MGRYIPGCVFFITGFLLLFCLSSSFYCPAQNSVPVRKQNDSLKYVVINRIMTDGNHQTKFPIIQREMKISQHDTIPLKELSRLVKSSRENIFNLRLFNFVTIDTTHVDTNGTLIDVKVHVIERWYIWPWPYFEISDRNFNSWLETTDLSRLTYGINLTVMNVRGRNETLVIPLHFGFNEKYGLAYNIPSLNRTQTLGMAFGGDYERNHEVIISSRDNKPVYYKNPEEYPLQKLYSFIEFMVRPTIYSRHIAGLGFNDYLFSDTVLRAGFAVAPYNHLQYFTFYYFYRNDHRDFHFYPLKGEYFEIGLTDQGILSKKVNAIYLDFSVRMYWQLFNRWYLASGLFGKYSFTHDPPYFLQKGLGYGRYFVRGYEYYVVDCQHFFILKNNIKFAILPRKIFKINFLTSEKFNTLFYALYMNVFTDLGLAYNYDTRSAEVNNLENSLLMGYGAGLDFTTYYDIVIRLEFALNGLGKPGIYLHFIAPI